jgi:hypothetical protein
MNVQIRNRKPLKGVISSDFSQFHRYPQNQFDFNQQFTRHQPTYGEQFKKEVQKNIYTMNLKPVHVLPVEYMGIYNQRHSAALKSPNDQDKLVAEDHQVQRQPHTPGIG